MYFEIVGTISHVETFAVGSSIREIARLCKIYGSGRWRKRKGIATIRLADRSILKAEIHWYEVDERNTRSNAFYEALNEQTKA